MILNNSQDNDIKQYIIILQEERNIVNMFTTLIILLNMIQLYSMIRYRSISRTTSEEDNEKKMKENNIENISQKNNQNYSQSFRTNNISTSFLQDKSILTQESKDINNNQFYNTKYSYNNQTNQMTSKNNKITSSTPLREKSFFETIPKIEILRLQVLGSNLLAETGAMFENQFLSINGPYRLYDIFYNYWESKEETHIMIISNLIIFLNRLLLRSDTIKNIMIELNIIQFCLLLFQYVDDESTKAQAVRAIALLCGNKNIICQTQFNDLNGIKSIVLALKCCVGMRLPLVGLRAGIKISNKYSIDKVGLTYLVTFYFHLILSSNISMTFWFLH